jgi:hypothetical protein
MLFKKTRDKYILLSHPPLQYPSYGGVIEVCLTNIALFLPGLKWLYNAFYGSVIISPYLEKGNVETLRLVIRGKKTKQNVALLIIQTA